MSPVTMEIARSDFGEQTLLITSHSALPSLRIYLTLSEEGVIDPDGLVVQWNPPAPSRCAEQHMMSFLCQQGRRRAVIVQSKALQPNIGLALYQESKGILETRRRPVREVSWPESLSLRPEANKLEPFWQPVGQPSPQDLCHLRIGLPMLHFERLAHLSSLCLRTDFDDIPLSESLWRVIEPYIDQQVYDISIFDRLVIFTDGSALPQPRVF